MNQVCARTILTLLFSLLLCAIVLVTNNYRCLDSDDDLKTVPDTGNAREKSLSGSITKTVAKVKSKLRGGPSNQQGTSSSQHERSPPKPRGKSPAKNTIYNPSALSTWQAITGKSLLRMSFSLLLANSPMQN